MMTVPVLTVDSGLKGSNLPPSGLSESSGFLSGGFCAPGAATEDADAAINSAAAAQAKNLNRLMIVLLRIATIDFVSYCDLRSSQLRSTATPSGTWERPNPTRRQLSGTGPSSDR